jgi:succinate-semialdehyde dehydrogenase/glutarate-semialdehyde dehydrogenase
MIQAKMLINGEWVAGQKDQVFPVVNPATEEVIVQVPVAGPEELETAITAADRAFGAWSARTPFERGRILRCAGEAIDLHAGEIAKLLTLEQGKPLKEAREEVEKSAAILRFYAEEGERICGRVIPNAAGNRFESKVVYQPVGVVAAISPWNYPIELLAWKIGAALAAGCTVVAKLPSHTPLSPNEFIRYLSEAGIPDGAINTVTGPGPLLGPVIFKHPLVKKIAFTGSTKVGKEVMRSAAATLKKITLELGGSLPMIICSDCNLEAAVAGAVRRSFRNMGQICVTINRIYVDKAIYEAFLSEFAAATEKMTIGNGLLKECDLGPMCTKNGPAATKAYIEDALSKGARLVCGGYRPEGDEYRRGYFFAPTILKDVTHEMRVMQEETFGPVVGVMAFEDIDEALRLANESNYGLAAIAFTESLNLAHRLSQGLNAGNVAINNVDVGVINAPYGGWKDSGLGYEHGSEGLFEYLRIKHIRMRYW